MLTLCFLLSDGLLVCLPGHRLAKSVRMRAERWEVETEVDWGNEEELSKGGQQEGVMDDEVLPQGRCWSGSSGAGPEAVTPLWEFAGAADGMAPKTWTRG